MTHPGWIQPVICRTPGAYDRVGLTLACGCVVVRRAKNEPKRARCELQRGCRWRQEVAHAG